MAHSKACTFKQDEFIFSNYCKSLGHPARRRIVDLLGQYHTLDFSELCRQIDLHRNTVQNHLIYLEKASLIRVGCHPSGKMGYQLEFHAYREMLSTMRDWLDAKAA